MTLRSRKPDATGSIANRVRAGLLYSGGSDALRQAAEFATSILLARLLMPSDFGVVAVVSSILQLSFVIGNFGMGTAVIQTPELSRKDTDVAFTMSAAVGFVLMAMIAAAGPWAAGFFAMPLLSLIVPIMSVQLLLSGISAIPIALLRRELAFRKIAAIEIGSSACYAVTGIALAVAGYGVWALVWAPLASHLWTLTLSCLSTRYFPSLSLTRASLDKFLSFGSGLTLKNVFVYISRNLDNLIVAKLLGEHAAGLYTRSFNLTRMPQMRIVALIYRVSFPAFCKLQNDRPRLHRWYMNATAVVAVLSAPILLGLAVVADDFTVAVMGGHWAEMGPVVRVLCLSALLNCCHMLGGAVIEASGRVRYEVITQAIYATGIVVGCALAAPFGIQPVAYAVLVASALFFVAKAYTLHTVIALPVRQYLGAIVPSVVAGAIMYAVVHVFLNGGGGWTPLNPAHHWQRLLLGTVVGVVVYSSALALIGRSHARLFFEQIGAMTVFLRRSPIESEPTTLQA